MARTSTRLNLLRDDLREIAAAFMAVVIERGRERYHLYADAGGRVRWPQAASTRSGRIKPIPQNDLVGVFDRHSSRAEIERALAMRLQKINGLARAA